VAELVPEQEHRGNHRDPGHPVPGPVARQDVRVSDEERTAVLDELRAHFGAGRIDLSEFEERTNAVVVARIRGELMPLLADLPELRPASHTAAATAPGRTRRGLMGSRAFRLHLYTSAVLSVFLLVLYWAVNLVAQDSPFWPIFPILAMGLLVGIHAAVRKAISD